MPASRQTLFQIERPNLTRQTSVPVLLLAPQLNIPLQMDVWEVREVSHASPFFCATGIVREALAESLALLLTMGRVHGEGAGEGTAPSA